MFSFKERPALLQQLQDEFDVLIIGGGITGAGLAVQAAASGLKTALIEMQDFAEGTSSRSTKLVHGGIRYLKNFDVEVVADTVRERAIVQQIAPHVPKPDPMLLPIYDEPGSTFTMFSVKIAMDLYDHLADIEDSPWTNQLLTKEEVLEKEPQIKQENLQGGGIYLDYRNNDSRLVIENIKKAVEDGAVIVSRVKAGKILHNEEGRASGVEAVDQLTGDTFEIKAKIVVNTSGPWSDLVKESDDALRFTPKMRPTKGVHLVVPAEKLKVPQPTYFDTGKQDGRMVFVIPRENKTYFGTTDTDYTGDLKHPRVTQEDVDYLLSVVNNRYPSADLTLQDIEASWAGLRPLLSENGSSDYNGGNAGKLTDKSFELLLTVVNKYEEHLVDRLEVEKTVRDLQTTQGEKEANPSAVSRGSDLNEAEDGLLTLAGGKLTDYRMMAEGAMKKIADILGREGRKITLVDSTTYRISGGDIDANHVEAELEKIVDTGVKNGVDQEAALYLAELYGSNANIIFQEYATREGEKGLNKADTLGLHYSLDHEMVHTPVDYLLRRTNHLLFMKESLDEVKQPVIDIMAEYFEWDEAEKVKMTEELEAQIQETQLAYLKEAANGKGE
ncbi:MULTISPECIES: type 1 glycerol-3-phosphate oxidase [unclassified Enterococcus]|jgi:alpha-glycerophosphate oxidase|uniref:type 1 glycerol-3-phosphate oxidase n=1 Tax=unclassified Enterococcus TaxID=2608891 RepID=UPI003D2B9A5C